jgi:hypothetical protein
MADVPNSLRYRPPAMAVVKGKITKMVQTVKRTKMPLYSGMFLNHCDIMLPPLTPFYNFDCMKNIVQFIAVNKKGPKLSIS